MILVRFYKSSNIHPLLNDLELDLEIERGQLDPMVQSNQESKKNTNFAKKKNHENEDKFTIVLDKERGIYQYPRK